MNIFVFGSCRVLELAAQQSRPDFSYIANISFTYTIQEVLQYMKMYHNPSLTNQMQPEILLFVAKLENRIGHIKQRKKSLEKSDVVIVEISTLRCNRYKDKYICYLSMGDMEVVKQHVSPDDILVEYITLGECIAQMLEFHAQVKHKPTIFVAPSVYTNRFGREMAWAIDEVKSRLTKHPHIYVFDSNEAVGEPEDFMPFEGVVGSWNYGEIGGEKKLDYLHYSELGKAKLAEAMCAFIQNMT